MIKMVTTGGSRLSYALNVAPTPLQVSLETVQTKATIQIIAVNQTGAQVALESLAVTVDIGKKASDLADDTTTQLTANIQPNSDWQLQPVTLGEGQNLYKWNPPLPPVTLDPNDSVVITFTSVPINLELGTTELTITEAVQGQDPTTARFDVTKFPFGFYFSNLQAYGLGGAPVSQVPYNGQVKLQWTGSLTDAQGYTVYYGTNAGQVTATVSILGEWTSPPLTNNTVFIVEATAKNGAGEPVTSQLITAVTVQTPDLVANSISVGVPPPDLVANSISVGGQTISSFDQILPQGTIVMWSGALATIPSGWALCDGTSGTPDLRSRFIFGAGDGTGMYEPLQTGGTASHVHSASAEVSVQVAGAHHHLVNGIWADKVQATLTLTASGGTVVQGIGGGWARTATSDGTVVGDHTHPATATVTVNPASNIPPFMSLAFIMKVS
jgi:hypothetical protein